MKIFITKLVLLSILTIACSLGHAELQLDKNNDSGIQFEHATWQEILLKAKNENKLIFIDAYTTWCGPCKMMAKNVFTDTDVGSLFNQNFVNVKLDMEKEPGLSLKSKLNVTAYPTLIFIDANENIEHKAVGALNKLEFLNFANTTLKGEVNLSDYNTIYEREGVSSYEFLVDYLKVLESAGEKTKLKSVAEKYLNDLNSEKLLEQKNWGLLNKYIHSIDNKAFQYLLKQRVEFETQFGAKIVGEKIYYTFLRQGNQLCDKLESGKYHLNAKRKSQFVADLEKFNIKGRAQILAYSNISTARTLENWQKFVSDVSKHLGDGLIDKGVMSLYNYALPIDRATNDKKLRAEAAKWCDMGLETVDVDAGFKNAFMKLKENLLKESNKM
ncbi:thioredoxin domain-containing protein [Labilibaculum sp. DW002]|uniref:Thioredoxin domain-containing protein n=1 Tax=Paralabilibaculum antarcticum TaxID=2912572 RepID=A0ABT5VRK3_9BACT|nr:thioredoxin domain-containing protein [Labilibaculum sp. DW002]MDE5416924.1 thioredoxin domain-containing protein [Labilibaculum sp. DW002]